MSDMYWAQSTVCGQMQIHHCQAWSTSSEIMTQKEES